VGTFFITMSVRKTTQQIRDEKLSRKRDILAEKAKLKEQRQQKHAEQEQKNARLIALEQQRHAELKAVEEAIEAEKRKIVEEKKAFKRAEVNVEEDKKWNHRIRRRGAYIESVREQIVKSAKQPRKVEILNEIIRYCTENIDKRFLTESDITDDKVAILRNNLTNQVRVLDKNKRRKMEKRLSEHIADRYQNNLNIFNDARMRLYSKMPRQYWENYWFEWIRIGPGVNERIHVKYDLSIGKLMNNIKKIHNYKDHCVELNIPAYVGYRFGYFTSEKVVEKEWTRIL
jgi:hypothetical protein